MRKPGRPAAAVLMAVLLNAAPLPANEASFLQASGRRQAPVLSQLCPSGGAEAEDIYRRGRRSGDPAEAESLLSEAQKKGSSKAALALGSLYLSERFRGRASDKRRRELTLAAFEESAAMGCPDAYLGLAALYGVGWGVAEQRKYAEYVFKAASMGSPKGMELYGFFLLYGPRNTTGRPTKNARALAEGRKYLELSLKAGNGDAGLILSGIYDDLRNIEGLVESLRGGGALGSISCLAELLEIYAEGRYGQPADKNHADCLARLAASIDPAEEPRPVDLDGLCPSRPLSPYRRR